jgi:hypothetical protein
MAAELSTDKAFLNGLGGVASISGKQAKSQWDKVFFFFPT